MTANRNPLKRRVILGRGAASLLQRETNGSVPLVRGSVALERLPHVCRRATGSNELVQRGARCGALGSSGLVLVDQSGPLIIRPLPLRLHLSEFHNRIVA